MVELNVVCKRMGINQKDQAEGVSQDLGAYEEWIATLILLKILAHGTQQEYDALFVYIFEEIA